MDCATLSVGFANERLAKTYSSVSVEIAIVSPELASQWLAKNVRNRPLNKRHYEYLGSVMARGDYMLNGETIVFDSDGNLLDGQHRLHGCIRSGNSFVSLVVRGIDPQAFDTIDGGKTRTVGDVLGMSGEHRANQIAACVAQIFAFVASGGVMYQSTGCNGKTKLTPRMAERVLDVHPGIRESVLAMSRCPLFRNQHASALHYLFSAVSEELAGDFADVLMNGSDDKGRPFNILREQIIRTPVTSNMRRSYAARAIKAFNAERSGARPKMFRFAEEEEFPRIEGLDYDWLRETIHGR